MSTSTSAASSATERAQMGKRLAWAGVVAVGANVRTVEVGDRVLLQDGQTGLYL